jgi:hypothetical protein
VPKRPHGVYQDGRGGWYFKVMLGSDPLTGKRVQFTKRGFRTAAEAGRERRELLAKVETGQGAAAEQAADRQPAARLYLVGIDADRRLAPKTRFDYRNNADHFVRPALTGRWAWTFTPCATCSPPGPWPGPAPASRTCPGSWATPPCASPRTSTSPPGDLFERFFIATE